FIPLDQRRRRCHDSLLDSAMIKILLHRYVCAVHGNPWKWAVLQEEAEWCGGREGVRVGTSVAVLSTSERERAGMWLWSMAVAVCDETETSGGDVCGCVARGGSRRWSAEGEQSRGRGRRAEMATKAGHRENSGATVIMHHHDSRTSIYLQLFANSLTVAGVLRERRE
ncbi:hypothetical protein ARMGADRAFT_1041148, partial [Armillaria gallica]